MCSGKKIYLKSNFDLAANMLLLFLFSKCIYVNLSQRHWLAHGEMEFN